MSNVTPIRPGEPTPPTPTLDDAFTALNCRLTREVCTLQCIVLALPDVAADQICALRAAVERLQDVQTEYDYLADRVMKEVQT